MNRRIRPGSIVVAADGSKHSERALRWASEQARLEHRSLVVVTVEEGTAFRINADAVRTVQEIAPRVEVDGVCAAGDPRTVLVELAREAHLLVVGSHGRGAVRSALLGSVSAAVSRQAVCPVVVCRPRAEGQEGRGVLVAVDASESSLPVIEFAFEHASVHGQPLTAVHCVWDVVAAVAGLRNVRIDGDDLGIGDEAHLALAESLAGFCDKYPDVSVTQRVNHGLVDDVIGWRTGAWDLVVVGRHPVDTVSRLVTGSIATAVLERAQTNVAVVPVDRERVSS